MSQEHEEIKLALELVSGQFEFLEDSRASLSVTKNMLFKGQIGARPSDEEVHRDQRSR